MIRLDKFQPDAFCLSFAGFLSDMPQRG